MGKSWTLGSCALHSPPSVRKARRHTPGDHVSCASRVCMHATLEAYAVSAAPKSTHVTVAYVEPSSASTAWNRTEEFYSRGGHSWSYNCAGKRARVKSRRVRRHPPCHVHRLMSRPKPVNVLECIDRYFSGRAGCPRDRSSETLRSLQAAQPRTHGLGSSDNRRRRNDFQASIADRTSSGIPPVLVGSLRVRAESARDQQRR